MSNVAVSLWENIVQSGVSPICAFDTHYRLTAFNRAHSDEFFRIYAYRVQIGDVFPDLFLPEQAPVIRGFMARALAGETFTVTEEFGDPDLSRPYWEIVYTPLRDPEGRIVGAFHHAQDISVRLRAQAELASARDILRQSQKLEAMGQLTGGVAHDFNNLLTPIIGTFDLLQRRGMGGEREKRLIEGGLKAADRAKTLVQRLLAFGRRQPLRSSPVDLRDLLNGIVGLITSTSGPKIAIEVDAPPGLPPAQADANQLEMAVLNLSVNARDAMPDGGTLTLSVRSDVVRPDHSAGVAPGPYVRVRVADTGGGMTAEVLARAVEPFYSTKGIGKGTGLGLSMVHGLAAQLGGGMAIDSAPGKGTRVDLWLPVSPEATTAAQPDAAASEAPRFAGTALLVDDEDLVRTSTADMLGELGYVVMEATSAEEALAIVEAGQRVDLLVTDHLMAGMSGAELARVIRRRRPDLPILLVSGYAEAAEIAPDLPRLAKPFRQADLAASVSAVAAARRWSPSHHHHG